MTIALARDVESFLQDQVRSGTCENPSELVNDLVRSIRDQHSGGIQITLEMEAWLLEAADAPATPLTAQDFKGIRERVRQRNQGPQP